MGDNHGGGTNGGTLFLTTDGNWQYKKKHDIIVNAFLELVILSYVLKYVRYVR